MDIQDKENLEETCRHKLQQWAKEKALSDLEKELLESLGGADNLKQPMNIQKRDEMLQKLDDQTFVQLDPRHLLALGRQPLASMTRAQAFDHAMEVVKKYCTLGETQQSLLQRVQEEFPLPKWSAAVEFELRNWQQRGEEGLKGALSLQHAVTISLTPRWRQACGLEEQLIGAPFNLQDAQKTVKSVENAISTFGKAASKLKSLKATSLVLDNGATWFCDNEKLLFSVTSPRLQDCCFIPSHPAFVQLAPDSRVLLWVRQNNVFTPTASLPHEVVKADYLNALVLPKGNVLIQIGKRNPMTGGLEETESITLRWHDDRFSTYEVDEEELAEAEGLEDARARGKMIDFRNHSSLLSVKVFSWGESWICFNDQILYTTSTPVAAALGCPQEFWIVFFNGHVMKLEEGFLKESFETSFPVLAAKLFSG